MLEVDLLRGGWGSTTVVEDVSFSLAGGETVSIIGRNGVGKSTLLELIMGRAQQHSGGVRLGGVDMAAIPTYRRSRAGLGYVPQEREVFPTLSVMENLQVARRPGAWTEDRIYQLFPSLAARRASLGRQLSGGEQQMLSIARALIGNPKVLLMDEPTEGLAPVVVEDLVRAMRALASDAALAVLIVEQNIEVALDLSERCLVMERGRITSEESSSALRGDEARVAELMGLEA
jgi:branched-chain amino acid transport system ATP-binding protein